MWLRLSNSVESLQADKYLFSFQKMRTLLLLPSHLEVMRLQNSKTTLLQIGTLKQVPIIGKQTSQVQNLVKNPFLRKVQQSLSLISSIHTSLCLQMTLANFTWPGWKLTLPWFVGTSSVCLRVAALTTIKTSNLFTSTLITTLSTTVSLLPLICLMLVKFNNQDTAHLECTLTQIGLLNTPLGCHSWRTIILFLIKILKE